MTESQTNRFSRRSLLRYSAAGAAAVGGGALLGACAQTNPETGEVQGGSGASGLAARVKAGKPVRLAIANEPPYTKLTADGELTGAAPDVAKAVLKRMGVGADQVVPKQTDYKTMIPGLEARRWDMVTAGLFMNEARCADVLYSSPVIVSTESFALPPGNPKNIKSIDDVKSRDITVAVLEGSFELRTAKSLGISGDKLSTYPLAPKALSAMAAGRVDAVLLPTLTLQAQKENQGGNYVITPPLEQFPTTGSGAAFRPSDKAFHADYNKELKAFKKTEEFAAILKKWGFSAKAAREATTKELCATPAG